MEGMSKSINEWAREVHLLAVSKGWHERPMRDERGNVNADAVGAKIALIHSEISEALEELRNAKGAESMRPGDRGLLAMYTTVGGNGKPEGFDVELADAIIRILDLAEALGLDMETALAAKHAYNQTRSYRHNGKSL